MNKNIGDCFLLVWKLPPSDYSLKGKEQLINRTKKVKTISDLALIAFLKIISGINKKH